MRALWGKRPHPPQGDHLREEGTGPIRPRSWDFSDSGRLVSSQRTVPHRQYMVKAGCTADTLEPVWHVLTYVGVNDEFKKVGIDASISGGGAAVNSG